MRTNKTYVVMILLMGVMAFYSCNNDVADIVKEDVEVSFTAGISQPETRVAGNSWEVGDAIGVYMLEHAGAAILAENRKHVTGTAGGAFSAESGQKIYYPADETQVDFIAYYPYSEESQYTSVSGTNLNIEIGDQNEQEKFDLLWVKDNTGYTKSQGTTEVDLSFAHMLTKLVINVKADAGVNIPTDMAVTIMNTYTKNEFDLLSGELTATPDTKANLLLKKVNTKAGYVASYEAILIPYSYTDMDDVKVEFVTTGNTFAWNLGAREFLPKNKYTYNITLTPIEVKVGKGSITEWTDNPEENETVS